MTGAQKIKTRSQKNESEQGVRRKSTDYVNAAFYACNWLDSRKSSLVNFGQTCLPEASENNLNSSRNVT